MLRKQAERLLAPGESLSTFVESAIRQSIERREADKTFGARALESRNGSQKSGRYHSAASVLQDLKARTHAARKRQARAR